MGDITKVPALDNRPETGPMQFGDDWPGVFIRGNNALMYANTLEAILTHIPDDSGKFTQRLEKSVLIGLVNTLRSCSIGDTGWPP